ncbi:PIN domain-containing protein [Baekduia sp.]|uniref:PIN domain-containing protein n=1 Tax=Baekduia sp. TaxID=2600305 RepID=UPI002E0C514D|nr:PIN domain-containing protein [Baekduia sp.]
MGPGAARDASRARGVASLIAFVDTNVLIRHLTGDPPGQAGRATAALPEAEQLLVTDVVFAECVFVLESFYETPPAQVAMTMRALLAMATVAVADRPVLLRALEIYEQDRLHFAEAQLVAAAEASGVGRVLSFDKALKRATSIAWWEP